MKKRISILNSINKKIILDIEVADNFFTRSFGLMFRPSLGSNNGVLFTFSKEDYYLLWMLFTFIPLEALFISKHGKIVDIINLTPNDLTIKTSSKPAKYVLEVNRGFSRKNSIKIGSKVYID